MVKLSFSPLQSHLLVRGTIIIIKKTGLQYIFRASLWYEQESCRYWRRISVSVLTRLIHKYSLCFIVSSSRTEIQFLITLPTAQQSSFGVFKNAVLTASSKEKGDPLNCLASLCYKQEHEQLLQIIKFWGG